MEAVTEPKGFIFASSSCPEHLTLGDVSSSFPEHLTLIGDAKSSIRVRVGFSFSFFFNFRLVLLTIYSETA